MIMELAARRITLDTTMARADKWPCSGAAKGD